MNDSKKTKKDLLAELEALRGELDALKATTGNDGTKPADDGITRRAAVAGWVAPVVLSIPLVALLSTAQAESRAPTVSDKAPVPTEKIFEDGFESGDTSRWSSSKSGEE